MMTIFGTVWDKTHIVSNNISICVSGIADPIGTAGYFLIHDGMVIKRIKKG